MIGCENSRDRCLTLGGKPDRPKTGTCLAGCWRTKVMGKPANAVARLIRGEGGIEVSALGLQQWIGFSGIPSPHPKCKMWDGPKWISEP